MKQHLIPALAALAAIGLAASAPAARHDPLPQPQASIPFVNHGGIYDWEAAGRDTLYIQDQHRRWYRADLMGPCLDLDFAQRIGFDAGPANRLDRFSSVIVRGQRCPITSLTPSAPPPKKAKRQRG